MGMVFQAYYLIGSLTVLKNVILPQISDKTSSDKNRKEKAMEILKTFGLDKLASSFPSELSGGQQQRVAIGRSLINNPDIVLADEPVGNLDSKSSDEVMNLFGQLNYEKKKTIILVTHNPSNLSIAHRVFFIKDGEIINVRKNREMGSEFVPVIPQAVKTDIDSGDSDLKEIEESPEYKDLKLLEESYAELSKEKKDPVLLNKFKAREVVFEVLTGMTSSDLHSIEKHVENLLVSGINDGEKMFNYLDENIKTGGLGLDKRTAFNLTKKIKNIVKKIKFLEKDEMNDKLVWKDETINQIRLYLEKEFKINLKGEVIKNRFNKAIKDRLENNTNNKNFQITINLPISKGGLGINIRKAKKINNRLELLVLGKYKSN